MKHSMQKLPVVIAALLIAAPLSANIDKLFPEELQNAAGESVSRDSLKGKIVGVYFSAEWCPPCRGFTPSLVKFRNANKDDFEVVFVSSDRDAKAQKKYMSGYKMKWPAVKNGSAEARKLKKQFEVRGIPKLVILDQNGKTLTTDGRGAVSRNPGGAIAAWKKSTQ